MSLFASSILGRSVERSDRYYSHAIQVGLALIVWFATFASAANDLWSACLVFVCLIGLCSVLSIGHFRTGRSIELPWIGPIALLLGAFAVSAAYSYDFTASRFENWIWFFSFVGFYLLANSIQASGEITLFYTLGSYALLPLAAFCFLQHVLEPTTHVAIAVMGKTLHYGYQEIHANLIVSTVMSGFTLYWVFFLWHRRSERAIHWVLLAAAAFILMLGRSWWAVISLGFGFMYYYKESIRSIYSKRKRLFLLLLSFVLLAAVLVYLFKFGRLHASSFSESNRLEWWAVAVRMMAGHPMIGVGPGAFGIAYPYFHRAGGLGLGSNSAHNAVLQLLSETGLAGFIPAVWLAFLAMRETSSQSPRKVPAETRRVLLATAVTVLTYSLINVNLDYFLNKLLFLFLWAPFAAGNRRKSATISGQWMLLIPVCLVLTLPSWISPWLASTSYVEGTLNDQGSSWPQARALYKEAVSIDPANAEALAALAITYQRSYWRTHSLEDLALWRSYLTEAIYWKKDIRYLSELAHSSS